MPSNYTEHFKLSQWERPDKVLMDDFNDDNAKIDSALWDTRPQVIRRWVTEADTERVEIDISDIDWKKYRWVIFTAVLPKAIYLRLDVNGEGHCSYGDSAMGGHIMNANHESDSLLLFCPVFYRDDVCLQGLSLAGDGTTAHSKLPYRQLTTLTLTNHSEISKTQYIGAGTEISIMGLK